MTEAAGNSVRLAEPADSEVVGQMLHDFNSEFGEPTPGPAALAKRIAALMEQDDTLVLLGGSNPDGLAVLRFRTSIWTPGLDCHLAELYVRPARRGHGVGRALMLAAIDAARARGADGMDLGTSEDDVAARNLYESLGFINREGGPEGPVTYFYELEF